MTSIDVAGALNLSVGGEVCDEGLRRWTTSFTPSTRNVEVKHASSCETASSTQLWGNLMPPSSDVIDASNAADVSAHAKSLIEASAMATLVSRPGTTFADIAFVLLEAPDFEGFDLDVEEPGTLT